MFMPKRTRRTTKVKKNARKHTSQRKAAKRTSSSKLTTQSSAISKNKKAQWMAYKELQNKADKAWLKLRSDVHHKADPEVLLEDRNTLALILGECNYMTRELSLESQFKKR